MALSKYSEAKQDLVDVLELEPTNPEAQAQMRSLADVLAKEVAKQKDRVSKSSPTRPIPQEEQPKPAVRETPSSTHPVTQPPTRVARPNEVTKPPLDNKLPSSNAPKSNHTPNPPKRRRVPIQIIDTDGNPKTVPPTTTTVDQPPPRPSKASAVTIPPPSTSAGSSDIKPVSSRTLPKPVEEEPVLNPTPSPKPAPKPQPQPATFQDAKQARQAAKPTRVGGGIFRASGKNTIFPTRVLDSNKDTEKERAATPESPSEPLSTTPPAPTREEVSADEREMLSELARKPPKTLFDFTRVWNSAKSLEAQWKVINIIPPASFPALCGTSLEPTLLCAILDAFLGKLNETPDGGIKTTVREYMDNLSRIPRFGTIILFFNQSEKSVARQVWAQLGVEKPTGVWGSLA